MYSIPMLVARLQGAYAGLIRSYNFRFYIHKAIRKVLFLPFFVERSYEGLILGPEQTSILQNCLPVTSKQTQLSLNRLRSEIKGIMS